MIITNKDLGESIVRSSGGCYLNKFNILYKLVDGKFIGKRAVYTHGYAMKWKEDVDESDIKTYWNNNKDANYSEVFE